MTLRWSRPSGSGLVKLAFLTVAVAFGVAYVAGHWDATQDAARHLGPRPVLLALLLGAAGQVAALLAWRALVADLGHTLPLPVASRVFFASQLGKYIPGGIWQLAALVELGRRHHIPRKSLAVSGVVAILVSVVTAAALGGGLLLVGGVEDAGRWAWMLPVLVLFACLALHPRTAVPVVNLALRAIRRQPLSQPWSVLGMLRVVGWQSLAWLFLGLHCWALVDALGAPAWDSLAPAVGGFAVAFAAGMVFLPAPAGAGVREGILGALLSSSLTQGGVVVAVLLSRVLLALLDIGLGVVATVWRPRSRGDGPMRTSDAGN